MSAFGACEICEDRDWQPVYQGRIRDGIFGKYRDNAIVALCGNCGIQRLNEASCPAAAIYNTAAYREKLEQGLNSGDYYAEHDGLQIFTQNAVWPSSVRGATI